MAINLDDLRDEISDRKRQALKRVVAEVLACFAAEHVGISEALSLLALVVYEQAEDLNRYPRWQNCIQALEQAAEYATIAEQVIPSESDRADLEYAIAPLPHQNN
jgi:hypothetical protein